MAMNRDCFCHTCKSSFISTSNGTECGSCTQDREDIEATEYFIVCPKCGERIQYHYFDRDVYKLDCMNCEELAYFDELDKLSIEERIRAIEKWIYDYKPEQIGF